MEPPKTFYKKFPDENVLMTVKTTLLPTLFPPCQGLRGTLVVTDKRFFFYGRDHPGNWVIGYFLIVLFIGIGGLGLITAAILSDALWVVISLISILPIAFFTLLTRDIKKTCSGLSWERNETQIGVKHGTKVVKLKDHRKASLYIPENFDKVLPLLTTHSKSYQNVATIKVENL